MQINFLTQSGKYDDLFKFPSSRDEIWVSKSDILTTIKKPEATGKSKRMYRLDSKENERIQVSFDKHVQQWVDGVFSGHVVMLQVQQKLNHVMCTFILTSVTFGYINSHGLDTYICIIICMLLLVYYL